MAPPCGREDAFPLRISSKWDSAEEGPAHHVLCTLLGFGSGRRGLKVPFVFASSAWAERTTRGSSRMRSLGMKVDSPQAWRWGDTVLTRLTEVCSECLIFFFSLMLAQLFSRVPSAPPPALRDCLSNVGLRVGDRDFPIGAPAPFAFWRKFLSTQSRPFHYRRMFWNLPRGPLSPPAHQLFFHVISPSQIIHPLYQGWTPVLWA